ncbi:uncharacterized protein B0T15DRAFT_547445 [Chaetomium strumarium]|uniref:Uncharacterized protein n=1 Tax=Chaetomium strumarium TaxID=1170767 RepID=A0AAJ0H2M5_9PEZI|nr:hypothetical protein B0T15DRAFT_547445 [Chaetomium strumarium]
MCYREFIAYQCGHRSMPVLRPCPLTTAGHNFPVCTITPHKPTFAETMCPACERLLHSRWVLIREWEHRWLHERGVCGCDVIFPGLLTTPRVIGETGTVATGQGHSGAVAADDPAKTGDDKDTSALGANTVAAIAQGGGQQQPQKQKPVSSSTPNARTPVTHRSGPPRRPAASGSSSSQGDVNKTSTKSAPGDQEIPPLFTEEVTSSGEHRVAVRLSSLYAAEWKADHRELHEAGTCGCPTTFGPFQPHVREAGMTSHDRESLRQWREREGELPEKNKKNDDDDGRDIDTQNEDTLRRIAEIEKVFGKFISDGESPPTVNLPRLSGSSSAENQGVEAKDQGHGRHRQRNGRQDHNRFGEGSSRSSHSQSQQMPAGGGSNSSSDDAQGQGPLVLPPQIPTAYNPYAFATAQGYHYPLFPEPPPYQQQPYYFMPAHPAYATAATYNGTIPPGAYPWAAETQPTPGMPWTTQGPGPYRTPGLRYDEMAFTTASQHYYPQAAGESQGQGEGHGHDQNQPPVPTVQGLLPAPEIVAKGNGKGKGKETEVPTAPADVDQTVLPLCGLPIGAGPEGTSHMPSWLGCPLRRSLSLCSLGRDEGEADERGEEEGGNESATGGNDSDGFLTHTPPTPPQRCHSAAP